MISWPLKSVLVATVGVFLVAGITTSATASEPRKSVSLTLLTCQVSGSVTINSAVKGEGINFQPRNLTSTGSETSTACVDLRTDKSTTGGHSIVGYTGSFAGSYPHSTCALASGTLNDTLTWILDNGDQVTSTGRENIPLGNIFENIPGTGKINGGLFNGAIIESNALLGNSVDHTLACYTKTGVTGSSYAATVSVLQ